MLFPEGNLNLFLTEMGEPATNELRILVAEGLLGEPAKIDFGLEHLGQGRPIRITEESRIFQLHWDNYVAYAVRNESFWQSEEGEPAFTNHLIRRFNSAFLRFISETTFADDVYPGPLEHWFLATLTHCVDVVSVGPPLITPVRPAV